MQDRNPVHAAGFADDEVHRNSPFIEFLPCGFCGMDIRRLTFRRLNRFDLLTRREREVALALAGGMSAKEVARDLGLAPATVRNQTQSIYEKLEVDNRAGLVAAVPAGTG